MDSYQIIQLRARIERLERRESLIPGSLISAPEIWLVETRKHPGDNSYPDTWDCNVFPCVGVERTFSPVDTAVQTIADTYLCLTTDDTAEPGWPKVHCPWFIPPGFRFHAWRDPTQRLFHAIDPPHSLLCLVSASYGGGGGVTAVSGTELYPGTPTLTLGQGIAELVTSAVNSGVMSRLLYDGAAVTIPIWNHCKAIVVSETRIRHIHATTENRHDRGKWLVDVDPCT